MRLGDQRESRNIEDRRGTGGGFGGGLPIRIAGGGGLGGIILVVLALLFGVDPTALFSGGPQERPGAPTAQYAPPAEGGDELRRFVV